MLIHAKFASSDSPIVFLSSLLHHLTLGEFLKKDEVEARKKSKKRCFQGKIGIIFFLVSLL